LKQFFLENNLFIRFQDRVSRERGRHLRQRPREQLDHEAQDDVAAKGHGHRHLHRAARQLHHQGHGPITDSLEKKSLKNCRVLTFNSC
jgi:hypothetical protein